MMLIVLLIIGLLLVWLAATNRIQNFLKAIQKPNG